MRAFRHPERYGPRAYDPNIDGPEGEGQTRALGVARAVLDTFPVIKWGRNNNNPPQSPHSYTEPKTSQGYGHASYSSRSLESGRGSDSVGTVRPNSARRSQGSGVVDPAAIGRETCPICIADFEEGDDVRVLPCPGHHRFHKDCVDPWLLELSTSCPICREGVFRSLAIRPFVHTRFRFPSVRKHGDGSGRGSSRSRNNPGVRAGARGE